MDLFLKDMQIHVDYLWIIVMFLSTIDVMMFYFY